MLKTTFKKIKTRTSHLVTGKNLSLVVALSLLCYLLNFNSITAPFERDEGEYAYSAMILHDGGVPYKDSFLQKPPMIVYTYAFGQLINPTAVWPPRIFALIFSLGTILLVGYIAYKEWGKGAWWIAMFIYACISMFPVLTPFAANTEKFMILPLMTTVALFVKFRDKVMPTYGWVVVGFCTAIAILYKPITFPILGALIVFWLWEMFKTNNEWKTLVKPFTVFTLSGLITTLIVMLPIILRGGFPGFWEQVVVFNSAYATSFGLGLDNAITYLGKFGYYWFLALPIIWFFITRPKHWMLYPSLWFVGFLTIYTTPIGHYYLLIIPFIALMVAAGINSFSKEFVLTRRNPVLLITTLVTLILLLLPFKQQFSLTSLELVNWVYGTVNPFAEAKEVAGHVSLITTPDDKIFVAGSEPEIYFYAQRKSVSKFVITYPLNLPTTYREQYQKEAVDDLTQNQPTVIVVSKREMSGLWDEKSPTQFIDYLDDLLSEKYSPVGGYVWDEFGGYWEDNVTESLMSDSSYVVYKRNGD